MRQERKKDKRERSFNQKQLTLFLFFIQVFPGNTDQETVVTNVLIPPIKARYLRLKPTEWQHTISLRMELYGCLGTVLFHVLGKGTCMT